MVGGGLSDVLRGAHRLLPRRRRGPARDPALAGRAGGAADREGERRPRRDLGATPLDGGPFAVGLVWRGAPWRVTPSGMIAPALIAPTPLLVGLDFAGVAVFAATGALAAARKQHD